MPAVACDGCGEVLGDLDGPNGALKARRVSISNGRMRVKCPKCHHHHEVGGVAVVRSGEAGKATAPRGKLAVVVVHRATGDSGAG